MRLQTLFGPVALWRCGPFTVVRTKEQQKLLGRLQNAEMGFSYVHSHILPGLRQSRDQHMINSERLKEEVAALKAKAIEAQRAETGTGSVEDESAVAASDLPKGDKS